MFNVLIDADPETGHRFLETFGRDLQLAVNMFVEHGPSTPTNASAPVPTTASNTNNQPNANIATNGDSHNSRSPQVRAPISQKVECLNPEVSIRQPIVFKRKLTVFDGQSPTANSGSTDETLNKKRRTLAELFRPPAHLLLPALTLEDARSQAIEKRRHLLVSLHNEREFACFALVRDVWNHHAVQEIVGEHFALAQFGMGTPEGERFARLYHVTPNTWPFVAVIDPRTGEQLATIAGTHDPDAFLERLSDIISDRLNDISDGHPAPVAIAPNSGSSSISSSSSVTPNPEFVSSSSLASGSGSNFAASSFAAAASSVPVPEPPAEVDRNELATLRLRFLESHASHSVPSATHLSELSSPLASVLSAPPAPPPVPAVSRHSVDLRGASGCLAFASAAASDCANIIVRLPDATRLHLLAHRLQPLQVRSGRHIFSCTLYIRLRGTRGTNIVVRLI